MSSNKDTHVTEKQTIGDFIDSHKESAILIIGLIVLLVGVLKLGHMLLNVCNEARSTPVVRKILCFYSKTGKFQTKAKEAVSNEDDHACINLHYDDHLSNGRAVYTEQRDENDRLGRDISVTIKDSEAGAEYSNDQDETLPMLVIDHVPGVMSPPRYYELTKLGDG